MLTEHRIDDADEGLVAIEQSVPPGEQIPFQPSLALVLAEHRVQNPTGGREKLVLVGRTSIPLPVGNFKYRTQEIRERLIRTEEAEIARVLIKLDHIAQELAKHQGILAVNGAGLGTFTA